MTTVMDLARVDEPTPETERWMPERWHGPDPRTLPARLELSATDLQTIKETIAPGLNDAERGFFIAVAQASGLNPLLKQLYAWRDGGKLVLHCGIDGLRLVAKRSGSYEGQAGPHWCGPDGEWKDVWLSADPPSAARVGVYIRGSREAIWGVATWAEFGRPKYDRARKDGKQSNWVDKPSRMLEKCAEAAALRKGFPVETADLRITDELPARAHITIEGEQLPALNAPQRVTQILNERAQPASSLIAGGAPPAEAPEDLALTPTPAGKPPQTELLAAKNGLFASYKAAYQRAMNQPYPQPETPDAKQGMMTACERALLEMFGEQVSLLSRNQLTAQQCRALAHHFEERGLPALDDPFDGE